MGKTEAEDEDFSEAGRVGQYLEGLLGDLGHQGREARVPRLRKVAEATSTGGSHEIGEMFWARLPWLGFHQKLSLGPHRDVLLSSEGR